MIASCTYPLAESGAAELLDVARTHQFAIARRQGNWEVLETPALLHAKQAIQRLNAELEQRVSERTSELAATNAALRREIVQRQQAEDRLRLVIDTIPAMVFAALPDGAVDFVNQRWLQYLGLSLQDVQGWGWEGTIHPDDRARSIAHWRATMAAGQAAENELRVRRADGVYRWILGRFAPLRDEMGNIVKWYGVSTDIDDRKRAEEALRASEARLQAAIDAADIGLWDWDLVSRQIIWLGHHGELFGFAAGEFDGTYLSFEKRVHPEDLEELNRAVQRAREEGSEYTHEYRVVWPDGSIHWIAGRGRFVYNQTGQPLRMYGAVLDITERKGAEEAIRKSEQVLREAESLGHTGSWEQNLATGEIFNTEENLRLFFGDDHSKGADFEDYAEAVHPDDREYVMQRRVQLLTERGPSDIEYRVVWPDGGVHVIFGRATVVYDELGQAIRVYGTNVDITERKRAEESLRRSESNFRTLADKSLQGIAIFQEQKMVYANPAISKITGYTVEELK